MEERRNGRPRRSGAILALAMLAASPPLVAAGEGVVEINQSCALNGGCVEGDVAGFPVTLTASGSYRLTGDLVVPSANVDGILISASHVQLDLGGFSIVGPVACTGFAGATLGCSPASGSGTGVDTTVVVGVAVSNGSVRGMGFRGVSLGDFSSVTDVEASSNASTGIAVGDGSLVRDVGVLRNGGIGLVADAGSIVQNVVARANGSVGLRAFGGVNLSQCTSAYNGSDGVLADGGSSVADCMVIFNASDGIQSGPRTQLARNAINKNAGFGVNNLSTTAPAVIRNNMIGDGNALGNADNVVDLGGNYCGPFAPVTTCN